MAYDPFAPGPFPVDVRSGVATDAHRDGRSLRFQVWSPAAQGRAARHPLVLYSHASGGHRLQSSFLLTHLASHGYIVAAGDHTGNTAADVAARAERRAAGEMLTTDQSDALVRGFIADRVPDLRFLLDELLVGAAAEVSERIDVRSIGLIGWSFGGWAALATLEVDDRIGAVVALAPAGNSRPLPGIIPARLTFAWKRQVPTLFLVAERDRFTPLAGMYELFTRTRSRKRMFILRNADHGHFADEIDGAETCSPEAAHLFTRALGLAHLDAALKEDPAAERFLAHDPVGALRGHGVDAIEYAGD